MTFGYTVADYIRPATGTVQSHEALHRIRRYARNSGYRSIIVVEGNKPVGLIRWPEIDRANIPDTSLARDLMLANGPILTRNMSVREASARLELTRMDRLPVIDDRGELIGVFAREATKDSVPMYVSDDGRPLGGEDHQAQMQQVFTVHPGMEVYSAEGTLLGLVDRLFLKNGNASGFLVAYGNEHAAHKYLDIDVVESMQDETITLSVSGEAFAALPDAAPDLP